jgi:hypothetical protein
MRRPLEVGAAIDHFDDHRRRLVELRVEFDRPQPAGGIGVLDRIRQRLAGGGQDVVAAVGVDVERDQEFGQRVTQHPRPVERRGSTQAQFRIALHGLRCSARYDKAAPRVLKTAKA